MSEQALRIVEGPGRLAVATSMIFEEQVSFKVIPVENPTAAPCTMKFMLNSMERESGGGFSWNLEGYRVDDGTKFKAFYQHNVSGRVTGRIEILSEYV
jgi:hypothetical protein